VSPQEFVEKWAPVTQSERAIAQSHFNDLCELLGEPKPLDVDPGGDWYAFEKGAAKTTGGEGWADVWKRHCFGWEYKGKHKDLDQAYAQLQQYAVALENPPLLIVSDIERIRIVTNWTNNVSVRFELKLEDLLQPSKRQLLKDAFAGSERLRTGESRAAMTQKVARQFAELAQELEQAGIDPLKAAHFVNRLVFCMFAEDAGILPDRLFSKLLEASIKSPDSFVALSEQLFAAMHSGGYFGPDVVDWFNGGLFDSKETIPLSRKQLDRVRQAAAQDWSAIDPSILGTLFERGLDPAKRAQLGAHYTDPQSIMRIVEPVVLRPLTQEWEEMRGRIESAKQTAKKKALLQDYLARLRGVRILDPACGSGNFLYLALRHIKDLEHRVLLEAEALGLGRSFPELGPECVLGIELSPYAAELARVTVWIGELQWQIEHGFNIQRKPILRPLETIENRDALLNPDGTEAVWPEAEFIVGNPPFIGDKLMRRELGAVETKLLRKVYHGKVPGSADFVCFWFSKIPSAATGKTRRIGFVATQKIRSGSNNKVIKDLISEGWHLFEVWQNERWHDKGSLVRVSLLCLAIDNDETQPFFIDGEVAAKINPNLSGGVDVTEAKTLPANKGLTINGVSRAGPFNLPETSILDWLHVPNPTQKPNSDVLRPTWGADDLGGRWSKEWVVDFGPELTMPEAAQYTAPFQYVETNVRPTRLSNNRKSRADCWWRHGEARPGLRRMQRGRQRILVTGESMIHRFFRWLSTEILPDHKLVAFEADGDYFFGMLSSSIHRTWSIAQSSKQGVVNNDVYPASRTFATFPFPNPTSMQIELVSESARHLNELREAWLNPPEWTREETLEFPATIGGPWDKWISLSKGQPRIPGEIATARYVRIVPRLGVEKLVAARTLTGLYNDPPAWLRQAHEKLDAAVAEAYGWTPGMPDEEILKRLLELNQTIYNTV